MAEKKSLNLLDATLIVSGSMIGSGIFIVSADISRQTGGAGWLLLSWIISGVITLFAALSYGELAGMFPHAGGQYVYLKKAYNPLVGFLYGWTIFLVVQCGTIAAVAVAFAKFTGVLVPSLSENNILLEIGKFKISAAQLLGIFSIFILTLINSQGINYGKIVVRIFTSAKLIALFGIIVLGLLVYGSAQTFSLNWADAFNTTHWDKDSAGNWVQSNLSSIALLSAIGVGMVGSLFSSDAWNNVTFISGDIENPKRNIPLSLAAGTFIVVSLYLLVNIAYLFLLPLTGDPNGADTIARGIQFAQQDRVATAATSVMFGSSAVVIMAVLIMISTFGCNNGIILSSVRVYQAMAKDGLFFEKMKHNNKNGVPGFALWIQFIWSAALCLSGKYGDLLDYVMFSVMLFYILTIAGIFILRKKMPDEERPYKAFGYPVVPAIYILLAVAFCVNLLIVKFSACWPGLFIVAIGIPVYYYWNRQNNATNQS
ncbi:MAG TPA: amino acid permease [Chitinophagales bacterium]|nr:amino acid permease [Chitinophagales bacterium]